MGDDPRIRYAAEGERPYAHEWFAMSLSHLATGAAFMYGGPIFLVGSALYEHDPHDFDVRVVLQEHDFRRLFGDRETDEAKIKRGARGWSPGRQELRQGREELKQSRRWWAATGQHHRIDFQFQTLETWAAKDGPRLRLDHVPKWGFLAGLTRP